MAKRLLLLIPFLLPYVAGAATIHNDDSCDVAVLTATNLLLPYFEVDVDDVHGETTLFTSTNVTNVDRIAKTEVTTGTRIIGPAANTNASSGGSQP